MRIAVIGNGMVGQRFLEQLAERGEHEVTVFCEEPRPAYDRVQLTSFFSGKSAADLSVVAAVASSVRNRGLASSTALFGEVGLSGEIRGTPQAALRVREADQMGFSRIVLPSANAEGAGDGKVELIGVRTVGEALDQLI